MKAVILAGGFGTRISEESYLRPKPMIEIGGMPILWHIMKSYSHYGINEFVICLGYKAYFIKEYFANYFLHSSDVTFDFSKENLMTIHKNFSEPWKVTLVDTGLNTMTGGRLKKVKPYVENDESFCLTYGDGVSNVDIKKLIEFHQGHNGYATLTAVKPPGRFGALNITDNNLISEFTEKPAGDGAWINGGFFILSPDVFEYIEGENTSWENEPLSTLAQEKKLYSYFHDGFWQPMDTLRDKNFLEKLWASGTPPWKTWR